MNKKYFAKYLPVEGEVKDGDWYFFKGKSLPLKKNSKLETSHPLSTDNDPRVKIKLFLCSRDIQVGNKYYREGLEYLPDGESRELISYMSGFNTNEGEKQVPSHSLHSMPIYKVIGEISPEATWVKEGDELTDKDVAIKYNNGELALLKDCHYLSGKEMLFIKGPCGHFH